MAITVLKLVTTALQQAGAITKNDIASADEIQDAVNALNAMLSSWSTHTLMVYNRPLEDFPLSNGQPSYTIGSGGNFNVSRPNNIVGAFVRLGQTDFPLQMEQDTFIDKYASTKTTTVGMPYWYSYTNSFPLGVIRLYPAPTSDYRLFIRSEKPLGDLLITDSVDLPPGWERAIKYNLAVELSAEYSSPLQPQVAKIAGDSLRLIMNSQAQNRPVQAAPWSGNRGFNIYSGTRL